MKIFQKKKLEIAKILVFHSRQTGEIIPVLLHRTVCENVCLCEPSSSLVFNKSLSNLTTLLILRRYFQLFRRIFANLTLQNFKKKTPWTSLLPKNVHPKLLAVYYGGFVLITTMFFVEKYGNADGSAPGMPTDSLPVQATRKWPIPLQLNCTRSHWALHWNLCPNNWFSSVTKK